MERASPRVALRLVETSTQGLGDDFVSCLCLFVSLRVLDKGDYGLDA